MWFLTLIKLLLGLLLSIPSWGCSQASSTSSQDIQNQSSTVRSDQHEGAKDEVQKSPVQ
jgi:hypothetical protein